MMKFAVSADLMRAIAVALKMRTVELCKHLE
jgi:hypothetical protein